MSDPAPLVIPWERLSPEALRGVVEEFITREGTDYGHVETVLDREVARVRRQLERGEVVVVFDPETESVSLATREDVDRGGR